MRNIVNHTILNAAGATGAGSAQDVKNLESKSIALNTTDSASGTVKIQASMAETEPVWTSAASPTNPWFYVEIVDKNDSIAKLAGATGIVLSGTDFNKAYSITDKDARWINAIITAFSAGKFTLVLTATNETTR